MADYGHDPFFTHAVLWSLSVLVIIAKCKARQSLNNCLGCGSMVIQYYYAEYLQFRHYLMQDKVVYEINFDTT